MSAPRAAVWTAVAGVLASSVAGAADTTLRVIVPHDVSAQAARRAAGDPTASPAVLILEGVELGEGEGVTIRVRGPSAPGSSAKGPIVAVTGMVGRAQRSPQPPLQKVTLAVPLNERGTQLLVGRTEVVLSVEVTNSPGRPPLRVGRAFFETPR